MRLKNYWWYRKAHFTLYDCYIILQQYCFDENALVKSSLKRDIAALFLRWYILHVTTVFSPIMHSFYSCISLYQCIFLYILSSWTHSLSVCLFTLYLTLCTQKLSLSHHVLIPSYPDYVLIYCLSHHELTSSLLDCLITVYLIMYSLLVHLLIYCMSPLVLNSSFPSCVISYCLPHHVLTSSISNFVIIYSLSHHVLIYWAVFFVLQHCKQQTKDHSEWECETSAFFFFVLCSFKMYTIMALLSFLS